MREIILSLLLVGSIVPVMDVKKEPPVDKALDLRMLEYKKLAKQTLTMPLTIETLRFLSEQQGATQEDWEFYTETRLSRIRKILR